LSNNSFIISPSIFLNLKKNNFLKIISDHFRNGSAQRIFDKSKLEERGYGSVLKTLGVDTPIQALTDERDRRESEGLRNFRKDVLPKIEFEDGMFAAFSDYICKTRRALGEDQGQPSKEVLLQLEEHWGFWLRCSKRIRANRLMECCCGWHRTELPNGDR
jgi:hypothetical protein